MTIRAIEHVGITVPDLEQATTFFADAFGAAKILRHDRRAAAGPAVEAGLGVPQGATIDAIRMLRLGNGPNLELFMYTGVGQVDPVLPQRLRDPALLLYVDDIDAAAARLEKAGGTLLSDPVPLPGATQVPATGMCTPAPRGAARSSWSPIRPPGLRGRHPVASLAPAGQRPGRQRHAEPLIGSAQRDRRRRTMDPERSEGKHQR